MAARRGRTVGAHAGLKQLGQASAVPASPGDAVLERVPNPHPRKLYLARFTAPEFTSLCPITGQPDFAHLVLDYAPGKWLVESKSLKLYLTSFRNHGAFHEDCTLAIAGRLAEFLAPRWLRIAGYWYPRGGMPIDVFWQTGKPPAGLWIPDRGRALSRARLTGPERAAIVAALHGGSRRIPRDGQPQTPPGPEGSNGSGHAGCRGYSGAGRLHTGARGDRTLRMSYLVLARKWRPRSFDELVGQDHVRRALTNALDSGRIHHAFLFTGTRGVGKTTIARIFAKSLNCETGVSSKPCGECGACRDIDAGRFVDLLEVDAASRTKVDDTRELLDNVQYSPARGRYKVYLIDEVHMLSTHSFNALLKTLEEPPPHVKFLLATTDPQKLPVTVLSRCLQFHLRRLPLALIQERLAAIATAEQVEFEPAALRAIARGAEGSMRDALSLLDQVLAFGGGRALEGEVRALLGTLDRRHVEAILGALAAKDGAALMASVQQLDERAPDYDQALGELSAAIQRMALLQAIPDLRGEDEEQDQALAALAGGFAPEDLQLLYQIAIMARRDLDYAPDARGGFEMALLRMLAFRPETPGAAMPSAAPASGGTRAAPAARPAAAPPAAAPSPPSVASSKASSGSSDWSAIVAGLGLQGPAGQLAAHCVLVGRVKDLVRLRLDPAGDTFNRPQLVQKLTQALSQHYGEPVRLEIGLGDAGASDATPARQQAQAADERLKAAEQAIEGDPAVRAMRDVFGATVQPGSVKPLN